MVGANYFPASLLKQFPYIALPPSASMRLLLLYVLHPLPRFAFWKPLILCLFCLTVAGLHSLANGTRLPAREAFRLWQLGLWSCLISYSCPACPQILSFPAFSLSVQSSHLFCLKFASPFSCGVSFSMLSSVIRYHTWSGTWLPIETVLLSCLFGETKTPV